MAIRYTLYAAYECPVCKKVTLSEPKTGFDARHLQTRLELEQESYNDGTCAKCVTVLEMPAAALAPLAAGRGF